MTINVKEKEKSVGKAVLCRSVKGDFANKLNLEEPERNGMLDAKC